MRCMLASLMVLALSFQVCAATIQVPGDQPTIQAGINAATDNDTVLVASGTYVENINFLGKAVVLLSEAGRDFTFIHPANPTAVIVRFDSGEDTTSVINGFTVRNTTHAYGILCLNSGPIIENCDVSYCDGPGDGGGIRCIYSGAKVRGNRVHHNTGEVTGGGISITQQASEVLEVTGNEVYENVAPHGPGIGAPSIGNAIISRNVIWGNVGYAEFGGGIYIDAIYPFIRVYNNTVVGNSKGIVVLGSTDVELRNNIIAFNNEAGFVPNGAVTAYNCVWGNGSANTPGTDGIAADPLFRNTLARDYRLQPSSPCINAGDPAVGFNDPDGSRNDIGAFPFTPEPDPLNRVIVGPVEYLDASHLRVPISFANDSDVVAAVSVPLQWSSAEVMVDSVSWLNSRVSDWEITQAQADNNNQTLLIVATKINAAPADPGVGLLCEVFLQAPALLVGATVCFDTTYIPPGGEFIFTDENAQTLYPSFEAYCFEFDPPDARVAVPNGGETYISLHNETIIWRGYSDSIDSTVVLLSTNGGSSFDTFVGRVIGSDTTLAWTVPVLWEDDCRVLVLHYETGQSIQQDASDGLFSIHSIGDVNCSNSIEISDVVCLINYIFSGGLGSCDCIDRAKDVNCDGRYNISDVVYLVNFIFLGGPPPCQNNSPVSKSVSPDPTLSFRRSDGSNEMIVATNSQFELAAVELEIAISVRSISDIQLVESQSGLNLYWTATSSDHIKIGIIDPSGRSVISAGATDLFKVKLAENSAVESNLISGIAVDRGASEYRFASVKTTSALPATFRLEQNWPNPFNPTTSIQYALPAAGWVRLAIYNVLGNEVRILVDGNSVAGSYTVNWDGRSNSNDVLPSGVYFYRLTTGSHQETKKMLLLK